MDADNIIIKEVKMGSVVDIKHQIFNPDIEQYEEIGKGFKENPHPDFHETLDVIGQQAMQEYGFPNTHPQWGKYKVSKVKFDGVEIEVSVVFNHAVLGSKEVQIDLPKTNAVQVDVIEDFLIEAKEFVQGKKKQQGDLFDMEVPEAEVVDEESDQPEGDYDDSRSLPEGDTEEEGLVKA